MGAETGARVAVVTAIAGHYDTLMVPEALTPKADFICFADSVAPSRSHWQKRAWPLAHSDPVLRAKAVKVLMHRWLAEYDYSIWVDGNIIIKADLNPLLKYVSDDRPVAMFAHPEGRMTIEQEVEACVAMRKASPAKLRAQLRAYYAQGYPADYPGLMAGFVIVRKHNHPASAAAMELWWEQILGFTKRDQVSWPFVVWKHRLRPTRIAYEEFDNYFERVRHRGLRGSFKWYASGLRHRVRRLLT